MADPKEEASGLNVGDVQNIMILLDLAAQRGAFKPIEFNRIGDVYTKLNRILESARALPDPVDGK